MSSALARIEVRLPADLKDHLSVIAKERGVSLSEMAVSALQAMLEAPAPAVPNGLREQIQVLQEQVLNVDIGLRTFIKVFFSLTPDVPEGQKAAAAARGRERWQQFLTLHARDVQRAEEAVRS